MQAAVLGGGLPDLKQRKLRRRDLVDPPRIENLDAEAVVGRLKGRPAEGQRPAGIPREAAAILARHAPVAAVMSDFNRQLQGQSRQTPYPLEEIRRALS